MDKTSENLLRQKVLLRMSLMMMMMMMMMGINQQLRVSLHEQFNQLV
jgi:hypothetical protein